MKVLFVDVDGVMIPAAQHLVDPMCSLNRNIPNMTVAVLNKICEITNARVVMNTVHNTDHENTPSIYDAMVSAGFKPEYFYPEHYKTDYPNRRRSQAVVSWLQTHGNDVSDWVCIDDTECATAEHMLLIDSDIGLNVRYANELLTRWNHTPMVFML